MSIETMQYVWKNSKQKGAARLVLLAIADNANDVGDAFPGIESIARKCNMAERTVQLTIRKIEADGELRVYEKKGIETGTGKTNLYRVVRNDIVQRSPPDENGNPLTPRPVVELKQRKFAEGVNPVAPLDTQKPLSKVIPLFAQEVNPVAPQEVNPVAPKPSGEPGNVPSVHSASALDAATRTGSEGQSADADVGLPPNAGNTQATTELTYVDLDKNGKEVTPSKKKAPSKRGTGQAKNKVNLAMRNDDEPEHATYPAIWGAVLRFVFETDPAQVNGDAGRAGIIASWLAQKRDNVAPKGTRAKRVGMISKPALPEHVEMFAADWKKRHTDPRTGDLKAELPLDPEKFVDAWRKWASKVCQKPQPRRVVEADDSPQEDYSDYIKSIIASNPPGLQNIRGMR